MNKVIYLVMLTFVINTGSMNAQKVYELHSPDNKIEITIKQQEEKIFYSIQHEQTKVIEYSPISMELNNGNTIGKAEIINISRTNKNDIIKVHNYKRKEIKDKYNELQIFFKDKSSVTFRAYDDGIAYRFSTKTDKEIIINSETAQFNFDKDYTIYAPYVNKEAKDDGLLENQFFNSFENTYYITSLSQLDRNRLMFLPILIELDNGKKVVITEADLESYPGMYLQNSSGSNELNAIFAGYPKKEEQAGHNNLQYIVTEREKYIAKTNGARNFPWRVIVVTTEDKQLADCDIVYKLASPARIKDITWIKPGKVAWDWWNAWNIYGVDFESGINNDTYKYYIDFASSKGIEYVILDEGWAVNRQADLFQIVKDIDLPMLVSYAKSKNVGIVLWAGYAALDKDIDKIFKHYSEMGIKGFKVDFMDRDDQKVVDFYYKVAEIAAKYHLFIDFHGAYKPTGLQRTYPNVLNFEGVYGLEQAKWVNSKVDLVAYEATIPFIRMLAGQMDFTQGAMKNANRSNFRSVYDEPMSQGTRCRQLAEYIIFDAPFTMLCDNPSNYLQENECTDFIAKIPTTWDETIVIDGAVGQYIITARKKDNKWYVGAITNWEDRDIIIDLSLLQCDFSEAIIFRDGANAHKVAKDYKKEVIKISEGYKHKAHLAPGGGFVMELK